MDEPTHNPYNFVPLPREGADRAAYPGLDRLTGESLSGVLACELEAVRRIFTADHQNSSPVAQGDTRKLFRFLRSGGKPILQGTTIKGMVRAVYEAAFPSCLTLAAPSGESQQRGGRVDYHLTLQEEYRHEACRDLKKLCPACRLFGIAQGEEVHAQGRVSFSDAILTKGALKKGRINLAELSSPKPHHYEIYSATRSAGGEISGRKLYYHHNPEEQPVIEDANLGPRSNAIEEHAPKGTAFSFTVRFQNLDGEELSRLIACLVLDEKHGHKIGMAKPLGYGSCTIRIVESESFLDRGGSRYQEWGAERQAFQLSDWDLPKAPVEGELGEILQLERLVEGRVGYRSFRTYKGIGIDNQGKYVKIQQGNQRAAPPRQPASPASEPSTDALAFLAALRAPPPPPAKTAPAHRKRANVEVIKKEGDLYTLKDLETGQADIEFRGRGIYWEVGQCVTVRIVTTGKDGRITKVQA